MIRALIRKYPAGTKPVFTRTVNPQRAVSCAMILIMGLGMFDLGHGFGAELRVPPSGQPEQMVSRIDYDPKLTDPFFKVNEWSYPDYDLEGTPLHKRPKNPPRLRHTAKCFSTSLGQEHRVRFCEAKLLDGVIDLFIHEDNPAFFDQLTIRIRNGMFTCQYWTGYKAPGKGDWIWTTKRQELTLDKKVYEKGDLIKGRIDFECAEKPTNPKYIWKYGDYLATIKVYGVFRTIVK
ncbi:hypothetical protein [Desulfomonile tiedjei]|uniref:Uncharacterized protein n=1 Tax=Desulfomonile tiedjei (strain ATCC 49306 / DSM 6799 / DCB-1) TaxID=706587 RepID=I4CBE1_DESTA|nr:hypothetical protein [Desulfomonile tiedjei]AFM26882.1 hypothetical protein Desti_4246 [Desulfomonile tiedjei DSM 6799]